MYHTPPPPILLLSYTQVLFWNLLPKRAHTLHPQLRQGKDKSKGKTKSDDTKKQQEGSS